MTIAHRTQADGQNDRQDLVIEDAIRCMVSYNGTDWTEHSGSIEYAHATLDSASTGYFPFENDTGRKERSPWQKFIKANGSQKEIDVQAKVCQTRKKIIDQARKNLLQAQATQNQYYDQKRR